MKIYIASVDTSSSELHKAVDKMLECGHELTVIMEDADLILVDVTSSSKNPPVTVAVIGEHNRYSYINWKNYIYSNFVGS